MVNLFIKVRIYFYIPDIPFSAKMKAHAAELEEALRSGKTVILTCNCTVSYSGRAESFLASGDRIIIIKSDKTLLVHQPMGSNPINYLKDATHKIIRQGEKTVIKSGNLVLKEYLTVEISKVHSLQSFELEDAESIQLTGSEKDMSDMIYKNPSVISSDFKPLSREERTKYGFIDVFGHDKDNNLVIIECKRYAADFNAVDQLLRYVKKIKQMRGIKNVKGIIAAPRISGNALQMLKDHGCDFKTVNPPKYHEKYNKTQQKLGDY